MLEQVNELTRIERYLAGTGEGVEFFNAIKSFQPPQGSEKQEDVFQRCYSAISPRSDLESTIAKHRLEHARELCQSHIKQHQNQMQMMLSHSTATIADKLESGSKVAERIAAIGVALAAISGLTSPLALVTGYFGMNVAELVDGGQSSLYNFWKVATPLLVLSGLVLGILILRVVASLKVSAQGGRGNMAVKE